MAPLSTLEMGCEQSSKYEEDILKISEKFEKIDIENCAKIKEEQSTYNINDDDDDDDDSETETNNLENCTTIQEKGLDREKKHNNRINPYGRNLTSGGYINFNNNNNDQNNFNNIFNQISVEPFYNASNTSNISSNEFNTEQQQFSSFNNIGFEELLFQLQDETTNNNNISADVTYQPVNDPNLYISPIISDNSSDQSTYEIYETSAAATSSNYALLENPPSNIPATIEQHNFAQIPSSNAAEKELSDFIDNNKKLKQDIWILVNIEVELELITKLKERITSARFNLIDLNYIYAIIIRLMKKESDVDGKKLLVDYFLSDGEILLKIALKRNVRLMNFILEVLQNLGFEPNMFKVLHQIVDNSHVDLCEIFDALLNKRFDNKPSLNMFNVNCVDAGEQTILMIVLKNISINKGSPDVNMRYFDMILSRNPDITYTTSDGKNIFHYVINCGCSENLLQKIGFYYDATVIDNLLMTAWNTCDYMQLKYPY